MGMDHLSARLRTLRESKWPLLSQRKTSELCGLPKNALQKYERGEAIPTAEVLLKLADYYGVSVDYLLGRE